MAKRPRKRPTAVLGWREVVALPELGIDAIKVKVDTGARTSALHAFRVRRLERDGRPWVRFSVHPLQRDAETTVEATAPLIDERWVRSSSGRRTYRPVIRTRVQVGDFVWPIEITLVRRDLMGFRMLLGRQALRGRFVVDVGRSWAAGQPVVRAEGDL